jgi:hypothetical protein
MSQAIAEEPQKPEQPAPRLNEIPRWLQTTSGRRRPAALLLAQSSTQAAGRAECWWQA